MSGAAVYVGMIRNHDTSTVHLGAEDMADARQQFIEAMERDRADRGLAVPRNARPRPGAASVNDGPRSMVNAEIDRLGREAECADRTGKRWEKIAERLDQQRATQNL